VLGSAVTLNSMGEVFL